MLTRCLPFALAMLVGLAGGSARAEAGGGQLSGSIILSIESAGNPAGIDLDRAMLEAMPQTEVRTSTAWTDGTPVFKGPLVRDVLASVDADGAEVEARALNDYWVTIPMDDFESYDVILALEMDGEPLSRRDKGPIWIVYPRDEHAALQTQAYNNRWIWQLQSLSVR